jgi:hypothetical protein
MRSTERVQRKTANAQPDVSACASATSGDKNVRTTARKRGCGWIHAAAWLPVR